MSRPTQYCSQCAITLSLVTAVIVCVCIQSTSLNQFVLVAFENNGNDLDGFRVHLVALRCDYMTSVQSPEMSDNSGHF